MIEIGARLAACILAVARSLDRATLTTVGFPFVPHLQRGDGLGSCIPGAAISSRLRRSRDRALENHEVLCAPVTRVRHRSRILLGRLAQGQALQPSVPRFTGAPRSWLSFRCSVRPCGGRPGFQRSRASREQALQNYADPPFRCGVVSRPRHSYDRRSPACPAPSAR